MREPEIIKDVLRKVERSSTDFEKTNTELKRRYLVWNIETFNMIAKNVGGFRGSFGTGYPFYALDKNLQGKLPIIEEQIRYNRQLVRDGEPVQKSIYLCKSCLETRYAEMPDLKTVCKPCPKMIDKLKPRKLMNRLPDLDMWVVCNDGAIKQVEEELTELLEKYRMRTSDINPFSSIEDVTRISELIKNGEMPTIFLPIDAHIIEYSKLKRLIEDVPDELKKAKEDESKPYLPIFPKSYRKQWQYDDEAYNFIYDFLSAFTSFNFPEELERTLEESRKRVVSENTPDELLEFLLQSATKANFRRFQSIELEDYFYKKVDEWGEIEISGQQVVKKSDDWQL